MATKKLPKIDENRKYIWIQIENWLKKLNTPVQVTVVADRNLFKEGLFAKTVFRKGREPEVHIAYDLLINGSVRGSMNKKDKKLTQTDLLKAGIREALRIALAYHKKPFHDLAPEFRRELARHKLPDYAGLKERGMTLQTYKCSNCKEIYAIRFGRFKGKEREILNNKYYLTECCNAMIMEDEQRTFFDNEDLQKVLRKFNISIEQALKESMNNPETNDIEKP